MTAVMQKVVDELFPAIVLSSTVISAYTHQVIRAERSIAAGKDRVNPVNKILAYFSKPV